MKDKHRTDLSVADLLAVPSLWAITEDGLLKAIAVLRDVLSDPKRLEVLLTESPRDVPSILTVDGETARINIRGILTSPGSFYERLRIGTSYASIRKAVERAVEDPAIKRIVLSVNSPGGEATGAMDTADLIYSYRGKKPIVAETSGLMASGAYWVASSADEIHATRDADVGSIGVYLMHVDVSNFLEKEGINVTTFKAGKFKAAGSPYEKLTEEKRVYFQERVDRIYEDFVSAVARNRNMDPEAIKATEAKVFDGRQALELGLVDLVFGVNHQVGNSKIREDKMMAKEKEKLLHELEEARAEIERLQEEISKISSEYSDLLSQVELTEEERLKERVETRLDEAMKEGRIPPAVIEAGLADFLVTVSCLNFELEDEDGNCSEMNAADYFLAEILPAFPANLAHLGTDFSQLAGKRSETEDVDRKLAEKIVEFAKKFNAKKE